MDKLLIAAYVVATAGGLVLLKLGTNGAGFIAIIDGKIIWNITLLTVLGVVTYGISFFMYIILISKFNLGYIVPLTTALVYIVVFTASYFIFKENFTPLKVIAIIMIVSGVLLLNTNSEKTTHTEDLSIISKQNET